jgi:hypothetical protein
LLRPFEHDTQGVVPWPVLSTATLGAR